MTPIVFESADIYILSADSQEEKIVKVGQIIDALLDMSIKAAATGNFEEYNIDDGQTKIKTIYRSVSEITAAILAYELIQQRLIARLNNQLNGRVKRLVDVSNFNG